MDNFHLRIMEVLIGLTSKGYFRQNPEITKAAIMESAEKLENMDKKEISSSSALKKKAKSVLNEIFYEKKHSSIDPEILVDVNALFKRKSESRDDKKGLIDVSDLERDDIRRKAYDRFVKYFDASKEQWAAFAERVFSSVVNDECNSEKNKERFPKYLSQYDETDDENEYSTLPKELTISELPIEIDLRYIGMWDTMRDMIISGKVSAKKDRNLLYPCFFTDDISAFIRINDSLLKHVKENEKLYNNVVDIDFLNYFIDGECSTITDSYNKPRKPMSEFKEGGGSAPCQQPLEQIVFAKYKNLSLSTVSNSRNLYREGLKNAGM